VWDAVRVGHIGDARSAEHALFQAAAELPALRQSIPVGGEIELVEQNVIGVEARVDDKSLPESAQEQARADKGDQSERNPAGHEGRPDTAAAGLTIAPAGVESRSEVEAAYP
jgi:hypothetical protein